MPIADRHAGDAGDRAGMDIRRRFEPPVRRFHADDVAVRDLQFGGGLRIDLDGQAPHGTRCRVGQLLEPRQVRAAAIVKLQRWVGLEMERVLRGIAFEAGRLEVRALRHWAAGALAGGGSSQMPPWRRTSS